MKQILSLEQDYIIKAQFKPKYIKSDKGQSVEDFIDDTKQLANGNNKVESVSVYIPMYDNYGNHNGNYQSFGFSKNDILKLADKIKEIESVELTGNPGDDLPF